MPVKEGDLVTVEYEGRLENGEVFDASANHGEPLQFIAGAGQLIAGFDAAVMNMENGEEKEFTLTPEEAYGEVLDELVRDFPKNNIPDSEKLEAGMTLIIGLPNGLQVAGRVLDVGDELVKIDMNHPLAGKSLTFKIKVVEYGEAPEGWGEHDGCSCCSHEDDCGHEHDHHDGCC